MHHLSFRNLPFHNFFHNELYWLIEKLSVDNLNDTNTLENYLSYNRSTNGRNSLRQQGYSKQKSVFRSNTEKNHSIS